MKKLNMGYVKSALMVVCQYPTTFVEFVGFVCNSLIYMYAKLAKFYSTPGAI